MFQCCFHGPNTIERVRESEKKKSLGVYQLRSFNSIDLHWASGRTVSSLYSTTTSISSSIKSYIFFSTTDRTISCCRRLFFSFSSKWCIFHISFIALLCISFIHFSSLVMPRLQFKDQQRQLSQVIRIQYEVCVCLCVCSLICGGVSLKYMLWVSFIMKHYVVYTLCSISVLCVSHESFTYMHIKYTCDYTVIV